MSDTPQVQWLDESEQRAWRAFISMTESLLTTLNRQLVTDSDLTSAEFAVLVALTDREPARARVLELAGDLQWEKSRLSHLLSRMQRRGLIERQDCGEDRRGSFVVLTEQGRQVITAAAPGHVTTVRKHLFDVLSPQQVRALEKISLAVAAQLHETVADEALDASS